MSYPGMVFFRVKENRESVSTVPGVFASFFGPDPINLLGVVILSSLVLTSSSTLTLDLLKGHVMKRNRYL